MSIRKLEEIVVKFNQTLIRLDLDNRFKSPAQIRYSHLAPSTLKNFIRYRKMYVKPIYCDAQNVSESYGRA